MAHPVNSIVSPAGFISELSSSFVLKAKLAAYTFAVLGTVAVLLIQLGASERIVLYALAFAVVPFQYAAYGLLNRRRHCFETLSATENAIRPGEELKEIRIHLGITTREVAERSTKIAEQEKNTEFLISNSWLTEIETHSSAPPSFHKLFTLACIYHVSFARLLSLYGVELQKIAEYQNQMPIQKTHLIRADASEEQAAIELPVRFDPSWDLNETHLLSRIVEAWGRVPLALLRRLDVRHHFYGYVGLEDYTLYPLIKPGSFVQIDPEIKKLKPHIGRSEFDRPIYFFDLRGEYACGWCELLGDKLLVVPHPLSPCKIRVFEYPEEAEIVGQVTGVAMQIAVSQDPMIADTSEPSKQS